MENITTGMEKRATAAFVLQFLGLHFFYVLTVTYLGIEPTPEMDRPTDTSPF